MTTNLLGQQGIVQKEIAGKQCTLQLLPATDAIEAAQELIKLFAIPLGSAFDSGVFEGIENIHDVDAGKNLAMSLVSSLGNTDVIKLIKKLTSGITVDGVTLEFDTYFRGKNLGQIPAFVSWSIQENGLTPQVFMKGFSETMGVDILQTLSTMSQKNQQEDTQEK